MASSRNIPPHAVVAEVSCSSELDALLLDVSALPYDRSSDAERESERE
jgi:hypothetical protein